MNEILGRADDSTPARHVRVDLQDWAAAQGLRTELQPALKPLGSLSVQQFADQLDRSVHAAYRLLEAGAVPGAFKPYGLPRSRWFIPADAAERFVSRGGEA